MSIEKRGDIPSPELQAQETEIRSVELELSRSSQQRIHNEQLKKLNEKYLLQADLALHEGKDFRAVTSTYNQRLAALEILQDYSSESTGFVEFAEILLQQSMGAIDGLLGTVAKDIRFAQYVQENGFPNSELELDIMNQTFGLELKFEIRNRVKKINTDESNIQSLTQIYSELGNSLDRSSKTILLLEKVTQGNKSAYIELRGLLLNDPRELNGLLLAAKKQDKETGSSCYEQLKYTLITIEPSFESQIQRFEQNYNPAVTLKEAYIRSLSGSDLHYEGGTVISYSEDGGIIAVDASKKPPYRSIGLADGEYLLESNYPISELHKPHAEYMEVKNRLVPQIQSANILKTPSVQGHIEDMLEHGFSIGEVKVQLARCYCVDVSYLGNIDDLKPESLEQFAAEKIKALDGALVEYQHELHKKTLIQKEKVQEADKEKREILTFIHSIGFDLIDQHHTDALIAEIQSNSLHVEGLNLDPNRLEIGSGRFGESATEEGGTKWKENLIRFFNKMMSGKLDEPLSVDSHVSTGGKSEDRTEMYHNMKSYGILSSTDAFNIDTARENLRTPEQ